MKRSSYYKFLFCFAALFSACVGGSSGVYTGTNQLAVDPINNILFVAQPDGVLYTLSASDRESLPATSDQPFVSEDSNEEVSAFLPPVVTQMAAFANGTSTLLYVMGAYDDGVGNIVFNRIRVFSFDGSAIALASISPVILDDGDAAADETDNSFADMLVDQDNDLVFVTDATAGQLHVLNAATGVAARAPLTIVGRPQGMALDDNDNRLYVCNSSAVDAEQVITVVNLADFSTTTIDTDAPCYAIAVATGSSGTAMLIRRSDTPVVQIRKVDTTTYAASTAIDTTTTDFLSGTLSSGLGISSTINDMVLTRTADGALAGYLSEQDGNLEFITITSDASSYALETVSTAALNITEGDALVSSGVGDQVFFVAESGNLVIIDVATEEVDIDT